MIPEVVRDLAPYQHTVTTAQEALDTANRSTKSPLGVLVPAGKLIAAYEAYVTRLEDLVRAAATPPGDPEYAHVTAQMHGDAAWPTGFRYAP